MRLRPGQWSQDDTDRVSGVLWPVGLAMVISAAGMQLGLMIGAETTTVTMISPAATPGWFGPPVMVGFPFRSYWAWTGAAGFMGLMSMIGAVALDRFQNFKK